MPKPKKPRKKRQPYNRWPTAPRFAFVPGEAWGGSTQALRAVLQECFDPRCLCGPGEVTTAPMPRW